MTDSPVKLKVDDSSSTEEPFRFGTTSNVNTNQRGQSQLFGQLGSRRTMKAGRRVQQKSSNSENSNTSFTFGQQAKLADFGFGTPTTLPSLFGQSQQAQTSSLLQSPSNTLFRGITAFDAQQATGTVIKFIPVIGTDTVVKNGVAVCINTKWHSITVMEKYKNKSFEEIRFENYASIKKELSRTFENIAPLINSIVWFRNWKCHLCKGYLSIPPIRIANKEGHQQICGRCTSFGIGVRNVTFEKMAVHIKFPCIYPDCTEELDWNEPVSAHEQICPHKTIKCPDESCQTVIKLTQVIQHFLKEHNTDGLQNSEARFLCTIYSNWSKQIIFNQNLFIINFKYRNPNSSNFNNMSRNNAGEFFCQVLSIFPTNQKFDMQVTSNDSNTENITINNRDIYVYDERQHCFRCRFLTDTTSTRDTRGRQNNAVVEGTDNSVSHAVHVKVLDEKSGISIKNNVLMRHWESSRTPMRVTIRIRDPDKTSELFHNKSDLMNNLECPVCFKIMTAPIYVCGTGHSVCNLCKNRIQNCPLCRSTYSGSRNYALESVMANITLLENDK